ncbi:MAG: exodeoxyribonuclease VII large subunit [bacterium]
MNAELTVAEFIALLNKTLRQVLSFESLAVVGEVSEFKISQDRWVWFKLKDEEVEGVLDCFWTTDGMGLPLEDGMRVRVYGYPRIYPKSGKFSYNIIKAEPVGEGALRRAYELLKKKLLEEGLFAPERKRALPKFPETVGLITSKDAAAYSDFLRILKNRFGGLKIVFANVAVQGENAVPEIVQAFKNFNALADKPEVLILTRGGGSLEDLKAFNSEEVARAIFSSAIPVICAVGHERDESLADFVADIRASTPSNAAERLVPERSEILRAVLGFERSLESEMSLALVDRAERITASEDKMHRYFEEQGRRYAELEARMMRGYEKHRSLIARQGESLTAGLAKIEARFLNLVSGFSLKAEGLARIIRTLNPNEQFKRGWSLVRDSSGKILSSISKIDRGSQVNVRLYRGSFDAEVKNVIKSISPEDQPKLI